jgi:hypothetical protein
MPLRLSSHSKACTLLFVVVLLASWNMFSAQSPVAQAANQILYVNKAASGANTGTSWSNAFNDLQAAFAAAQATDQIWVAQGVYYPTSDPSNRAASFELKNGVALYGGFVGGESQLSERDWKLNPTILSGDIDQNDIHVSGIVTSTTGITGINSYTVLKATDVDANTVIDGFVVTAGQADDPSTDMKIPGTGGGRCSRDSHNRLGLRPLRILKPDGKAKRL